MESYKFWRERKRRFRKLSQAQGAADLHAIRADVDLPSLLTDFADRTRAAISNPSFPAESVVAPARVAARAGRILLDGEQADRWIVAGGPADDWLRTSLQNAFRAEAIIAAVAADEADAAATDQAALEAWLNLLARAYTRLFRYGGVLEKIVAASADMCNQFAARAYRHERAESIGRTTTQATSFQKRAAWLNDQMTRANLTRHRIGVLGDLDKATVDRILRGERVHPQSLNKLARAIGVDRSEIPDD